ncbi:hypothetical protein V2J09_003875 [Rumex salicifolius]
MKPSNALILKIPNPFSFNFEHFAEAFHPTISHAANITKLSSFFNLSGNTTQNLACFMLHLLSRIINKR